MLIALYVLTTFGEGAAADLDVTLIVNPKATEIYAGTGKIVITADAIGKNLTFTWRLSGPGTLEAEGAAAFYIPPQKIEHSSEYAIVTVTVKEASGQATVKSVTFAILPSPDQAPTPLPKPDFTEKKGGKKGLVALGLVAAAALAGGIALAGGGGDDGGDGERLDPPPATCAGVIVGGYCWYLGALGLSCDSVCGSHGGYHNATKYYAGSAGTHANCERVLRALAAPNPTEGSPEVGDEPASNKGCYVWIYVFKGVTYIYWVRGWTDTEEAVFNYKFRRACACNE